MERKVICENCGTFNDELVENNEDISIIGYITKVNDLFYHNDIDFMNDFMELVNKDECCVNHDLLLKYGVLTHSSADVHSVKRLIENNDLQEHLDYQFQIELRDHERPDK